MEEQQSSLMKNTFDAIGKDGKYVGDHRSFSPLAASVASVLRREVIEGTHLARLILRYGKEPSDNAPLMVAQVLKEFAPQSQFEKFPILIEAYKGKEHQLLDTLITRLVPPHKRGLFRARPMMLRAPPVPEADVALARRIIHKCFAVHRPSRMDEISSLAHLLAPLVTLMHQHGNSSRTVSANPLLNSAPGQMDYLKEEDLFGKFVKKVLEDEIGIVPRVVGKRIGGGGGSVSPTRRRTQHQQLDENEDDPTTLNLSPAQKARLKASQEQERKMNQAALLADQQRLQKNSKTQQNQLHDDELEYQQNLLRSPSFLQQLFDNIGGGGKKNSEIEDEMYQKMPAIFKGDISTSRSGSGGSPRSASLAMDAVSKILSPNNNSKTSPTQKKKVMAFSFANDDDVDDPYDSDEFEGEGETRRNRIPPIKERVVRIYARYEPAKLPFVDEVLKNWRGREELLITSLTTKYGPEPPFNVPIRNFSRQAHLTNSKVERPGALVNIVRDFYHATSGPGARAMIDDALEVAFPLDQTAMRVAKNVHEQQELRRQQTENISKNRDEEQQRKFEQSQRAKHLFSDEEFDAV